MDRLVTESIERLVPYEAGKPIEELLRERKVSRAVKLASNENPYGPSPLAESAASRALASAHRYPDANARRLRAALAERLLVAESELLHGSGSSELIELLVRTFTTPEHHVVFGQPSFSMYPLVCLAHGTPFTAVPVTDWVHDVDGMLAAVTPRTRLLLLDNPNNPTGTYVPRRALSRLLRELREDVIVGVDEAYFEYADAPDYPDTLSLRDARERVVVLRTFSKVYGLATLRAGYAVGPQSIIEYMNRVRGPFNVGMLAQEAALAALGDAAHVARSRQGNAEARTSFMRDVTRRGLHAVPSQANFVLVDFGRPALPVYEALLDRGVIVRPLRGLPTCLRCTMGTPDEMAILSSALSEVLA